MSFLNEYYRAYKDFRNAVSALPEYTNRAELVRNADPGTDIHKGSSRECVIDMEWVEAIEKALPSIDKAIRENRRFIAVEEEIVPIEKSRKITSESVRHLAQHTNMIARVEGDEVTPETILNIRREESFAIYENRFLVLLLDTAIRFISMRISAMKAHTNATLSHVVMNRAYSGENETTRFTLDYYTEYEENDQFDLKADVSTMSDYARVLRVRAILNAFAATTLIRNLKGVEPVRPPITRTNLLLKNPYFRDCLELWTFLETYTKDGFRIVQTEADGTMDPLLKGNVEAAMDTVNFVVQHLSTESAVAELDKNYEAENQRRAEEAARLEQKRKEAEEARLNAAVAAERAAQEEKIAALTADYEQQLAGQKERYENALAQERESYEEKIAGLTAEYENKLAEQKNLYEQRISALTESYEKKLAEEREGFEQRLAALQTECDSRIERLVHDHEERLAAQKAEADAEMARVRSEHERDIAYERARLESAKAEYEDKKKDLIASYQTVIETERREAETALNELRSSHAEEKTALLQEHEELLESRQEKWRSEKELLQESLAAQRERVDALTGQENALRRELNVLTGQLTQAQNAAERQKRAQEKEVQKLQSRMEKQAKNYEAKLAKQERRSARKIRILEKKLQKALKKCPYEEVMAVSEDEDTLVGV